MPSTRGYTSTNRPKMKLHTTAPKGKAPKPKRRLKIVSEPGLTKFSPRSHKLILTNPPPPKKAKVKAKPKKKGPIITKRPNLIERIDRSDNKWFVKKKKPKLKFKVDIQ